MGGVSRSQGQRGVMEAVVWLMAGTLIRFCISFNKAPFSVHPHVSQVLSQTGSTHPCPHPQMWVAQAGPCARPGGRCAAQEGYF